jgi:ribosomal protein S18 acetylase RimI-like enzyme
MTAGRVVRLAPCDDAEYSEFVALQIVEYADQLARAGETTRENAVAMSQDRLGDLAEDRLRTSGHIFFVATSVEGSRVGWVWLSPPPEFLGPGHERTRWLSQLTVENRCRGRGWGHAILVAIEQYSASLGVEQIWLRVFDWNVVARRLYASHGYELVSQFPTDAHLRKVL